MNALKRLALVGASTTNIRLGAVGLVGVRGYWNKDWKPGPYPKTEEEKRAAAKKYNLQPEDYEPYPNDGSGLGDYPKLPQVAMEARDPYHSWDYPSLKLDYGEPVPDMFNIYTEDRLDDYTEPVIPGWKKVAMFLSVFCGGWIIFQYFQERPAFRAVLPKQYPKDGAVHYTFEPAE